MFIVLCVHIIFSFLLGEYDWSVIFKCIFNFIRNCQAFFQSGFNHFIFWPTVREFWLLHPLANLWCCLSLHFSHSDRRIEVLICISLMVMMLSFFSVVELLTVVFIYVSFWKVSVQIISPFSFIRLFRFCYVTCLFITEL